MCHHTTCISPTVESEVQLQYFTVKQGRVGSQVTEVQVCHHTTCISPTVESEVQLQYYTVKQGKLGSQVTVGSGVPSYNMYLSHCGE